MCDDLHLNGKGAAGFADDRNRLVLQMKSTTTPGRLVTQSIDDVCKLSQMTAAPSLRTRSLSMLEETS